ncbi:MAG: glycine cleavage system protein GcvH [Candidatus Marinimicrobia bacterium]|jgi:glycine cleavage system H protein|nr:glycine cleavage system protein GcvH [Candidatus Neomarinimicrobiota bacterium]MBT3945983.1 glycine cleavage system protein GcvH [Candidatus Neomarinimicrobiota bacterium]MBT4154885.1 glycine cleavage system protein GcvH [Candidatus Neomarinimicrobiota bacterium]MBT4554445.1 glycine cleavage system protein GcvH [Candidatus Neomarinimicrobiota bacterium]MBT4752535.1 glycine cleavage system protein GcvH [Candidatus Neomarinimicrobiota bacterium]|tara:strand:+ start:1727 stop:2104 length:378 start_codon:yes stop_codon:yes gene_type:complete
MNTPDHLLYTEEHEWADYKDDVVVIGITDYAQSQLGDVIFIELPDVGDEINLGDAFGEIEAVKTVSELFAPISGTITEVNEALDDSPEKVNSDPFDEGWLIKVTPSNPEEKDELMNFLSYEEFVS